ncbi:MAG: response regulator transcription factor [Candidatus Cyclobacteriaceae bacterium M3_2C_046]
MNEQESLSALERKLFEIDLLTAREEVKLKDIMEFLPGWIHLNRKQDFALTGLSSNMETDWEVSSEEAQKAGMLLINQRIHSETARQVVPVLHQFYENADINQVFAFFQYIRSRPDQPYRWYYTVSKIFNKLDCTISQSVPVLKISPFLNKAEDMLGHNQFLNKNFYKFQSLTKREKEILRMVASGNTNKQISDQLFLAELTVKTHRQNINKKLNISKINEYIEYASIFGLFNS